MALGLRKSRLPDWRQIPMNRKIVGLVVALAFVALPVVIKMSSTKTAKHAELAVVSLKQIQPTILASGNLVFRQEVQLTSEVIGKVSEVLVKEGDKITKGQVLLRLDPTTYRSEVAQQEANRSSSEIAIERSALNLASQQRNLDRSERLVQAKFIDVSKYDEAKHQAELAQVELRSSREVLKQANALLGLSRERLDKTEIRAPISGIATAVQIKIGETAVGGVTSMPGSSLMTIADVGSMMAEVNVDEADVAGVAAGQSARVFPSAFPDRPVVGTVERVSMAPKVGAQGRSYTVKLQLNPTTLALRTGMTCRVEIVTSSGIARPVVPLQAVLTEQESVANAKATNYVFTVVNGIVRKRPVELGLADDNNQEVLKGLGKDETVAIGPARLLRELHEGDNVVALVAEKKDGKNQIIGAKGTP
jgi:HlyD family secretion protein